jgi:phospho-N-acetylmuramoyl-pentapeptide-transferase
LTVAQKFTLEIMAAMLVGILLLAMSTVGAYSTSLNVPFAKNFKPDLLIHPLLNNPWTYPLAFSGFFFFLILVLVGSSDAVNLTDGLDGLAIGLMIISAGAMTVLSFLSGNADFARYLELARTPGASELTIYCGALTGASLGFLWYNAHPAEIFMGDVGSLALGGGLGTVAVLLKQELLLPFIGGVYVLEAISVILQVGSYKLRKKRIFKMAPIHHHFEQIGWAESKVITRFWILGLIVALFALTTLKLR